MADSARMLHGHRIEAQHQFRMVVADLLERLKLPLPRLGRVLFAENGCPVLSNTNRQMFWNRGTFRTSWRAMMSLSTIVSNTDERY